MISRSSRLAAAIMAAVMGFSGAALAAKPTPLTLINGWTTAPAAKAPAVEIVAGNIVHFAGEIFGGTSAEPFILPPAFRPATDVYTPAVVFGIHNARLHILPSGDVFIETEDAFSDAQSFTSFDGTAFAINATGFKPVTPIDGWTNAPFGTSNAAVKKANGIVYLKGAVGRGADGILFRLPEGFHPSVDTFIPIGLCNAAKGVLIVHGNGLVGVIAQNNDFSNAQCFTSLEGVSFGLDATDWTQLTPLNGWSAGTTFERSPAVKKVSGIVRLQGMVFSGTGPQLFTLPTKFRPKNTVFLPIDLCEVARDGTLIVAPDGSVLVQPTTDFHDAQCGTSLEGASFIP